MTPEEIQAAFAAQLEFNRQIQQQVNQSTQAADQRSLILDAKLDRLASITERFIDASSSVVESQEARIARQDALIERLDTLIERLVYREGRDNDDRQSGDRE